MCFGDSSTEKDKKDAAKDFDDDKDKEKYKNGPEQDRSCTDIFMCIIFVAFLLLMIIISIVGFNEGDPLKIVTPFDSSANICGETEGFEDFPYLFWPNAVSEASSLDSDAYKMTLCVAWCPKDSDDYSRDNEVFCMPNEVVTTCDVSLENKYGGAKLFSRYCVPNLTEYKELAYDLIDNASGGRTSKYIGDIGTAWGVILGMSIATLFISFGYLLLLKYIAGPLTFIALVLLLLLQVAGGAWAMSSAKSYPDGSSTYNAYQYSGIGLFVLAGVYLIILLCCCTNIRRAVGIVKATSNFSKSVPEIFAVPVVFFFISILWMAFWAVSALYLYSIGDVVKRDDGVPIAKMEWDDRTRYMFLIHLFGLFWVGAFIIGCCQFIIAACTVEWYFNCTGDKTGDASTLKAVRWIYRYHAGSIAFGALIIAIMQMIKLMFEYIRKKFENRNNKVMQCLWNVVRCCIWCIDYIVRFITKNAYIQVALKGTNFCSSAKTAFFLIIRNAGCFGITLGIANVLMFVGKAFIMVLSGFLTYIILEKSSIGEELYAPFLPVIIVVIVAYLVSSLFLSVFSFSANAMLHAFFFDLEVGGGHTPPSLQSFIDTDDDYKDAQRKATERKGGAKHSEGGAGTGKDDEVPNNME